MARHIHALQDYVQNIINDNDLFLNCIDGYENELDTYTCELGKSVLYHVISTKSETTLSSFTPYFVHITHTKKQVSVSSGTSIAIKTENKIIQTKLCNNGLFQRSKDGADDSAEYSEWVDLYITDEKITELIELINSVKSSSANALTTHVSGTLFTINDISPLEHDIRIVPEGKNLIPQYKAPSNGAPPIATLEDYGVSYTSPFYANGGLSFNGTATESNLIDYVQVTLFKNTTYTFWQELTQHNGDNYPEYSVVLLNEDTNEIIVELDCSENSESCKTFSINADTSCILALKVIEGQSYDCDLIWQLERGSVKTELAEYINPNDIEYSIKQNDLEIFSGSDSRTIKSVNSSITCEVHTEGAIVNVTYNRDINSLILSNNVNDIPVKTSIGPKSVVINDDNTATGNYALAVNSGTCAYGDYAMASGYNTIAGVLGYYYESMTFGDEILDTEGNGTGTYGPCTITLTTTQPDDITNVTSSEAFFIKYAVGDEITIINNNKFIRCGKITSISNNIITVNSLPFNSVKNMAGDVAVDDYTIYCPDKLSAGEVPLGHYAYAEGEGSIAIERASHAEGRQTMAIGQYAHTEGRQTMAHYAAHAEGYKTEALYNYAHAEGQFSKATKQGAHAEGYSTLASNEFAHAEGYSTVASGLHAHAEGSSTVASEEEAHAEGRETTADGKYAHAEGWLTKSLKRAAHAEGRETTTDGEYAHAEGIFTNASGEAAHAEGGNTVASGLYSHAEGGNTVASGDDSHAEGSSTVASGLHSHAEGELTNANARASHAEGRETVADGEYSHAEGIFSNASGEASHAEGYSTVAFGHHSHAEGQYTIAASREQHVQGKYNIADSEGKYADIVGNGKADDNRSNAYTLDWEGNGWYQGSVEADAMILRSPDGNKFKITVDNTGNLTTTKLN